jgi:hypothetical protein
MKREMALPESIAYLWEDRRRPSTERLFVALAGEALACLFRTDWEDRIRKMENILSVIKWRIRRHWERQHETGLDRLLRKAREEGIE